MKLSKSKLALAKVINENGGWPERALWAVQDNCIAFFLGGKPEYKSGDRCWYSNSIDGACVGTITCDEKVTNWHQTILSLEEYYQAYPKADYGWIEWNGGECPVYGDDEVDVVLVDGSTEHGIADEFDWHRDSGHLSVASYRLHKPDVKPEFCESVMRSIPDPEEKPTIEKLAQDYRNAKDYADRLQKEAGEAAVKAEEFAVEIRKKILELQELIGIPNTEKEPELVITNWRDLKVGDLVEVVSSLSGNREGEVGTVTRFDEFDKGCEVRVHFNDDPCDYEWCVDWKFIRRP